MPDISRVEVVGVVVDCKVSSCLNISSWSTGGDGRPLVGQDVAVVVVER